MGTDVKTNVKTREVVEVDEAGKRDVWVRWRLMAGQVRVAEATRLT